MVIIGQKISRFSLRNDHLALHSVTKTLLQLLKIILRVM